LKELKTQQYPDQKKISKLRKKYSNINARASVELPVWVPFGVGNPNETISEVTTAAKEGDIRTVGGGGGGGS
jgi:hypothetical protein